LVSRNEGGKKIRVSMSEVTSFINFVLWHTLLGRQTKGWCGRNM